MAATQREPTTVKIPRATCELLASRPVHCLLCGVLVPALTFHACSRDE